MRPGHSPSRSQSDAEQRRRHRPGLRRRSPGVSSRSEFLCYAVAYLDRVNVGFAELQMQDELWFSDVVYGLFGAVLVVGGALVLVLSPSRVNDRTPRSTTDAR